MNNRAPTRVSDKSPEGTPLAVNGLRYHKDRTRTHGYEPTREAAMAAFAKSWRRESFGLRLLAPNP